MILVDRQIKDAVARGELGIENFDPQSVQPATYDLRVGHLVYSPSADPPDRPIDLSANGGHYRLAPYGSAMLMTHEVLRLPATMVGRFGLKSGFTRRGMIASTGPQVDPGYHGRLFVSLLNLTPASYIISFLQPFLSIEFQSLDQAPDEVYHGPYQGREDIGRDILEDLVRLEGLNLSQMQSQFTELTQHVRAWSLLATRFDEFLNRMQQQSMAIERLAASLAERLERPETTAPAEAHQIDLAQAIDEVLELFRTQRRLFYSDIAERLRLDLATVIRAVEELQRRGLIEASPNE